MTCILLSRPSVGDRINDINRGSLIREGSENDAFHFPRSKKPRMDFLRQYIIIAPEHGRPDQWHKP